MIHRTGGSVPRRALVLLAWLLLAAPAPAGDWPQFRGPSGAGVSSETGLPVRWSQTENLRWKVALPGRGLSSPVIAGGRVHVTACTGVLQDRLHVLCFDAATGKKHWERQFWATGTTLCHPKTCMAAPTPVTDGERVYALFATGDLACLDKDGDLLWYRALERDYPTVGNNVGMAASPILWKDVLLLPMENVGESFVAGLDKHTGRNRWKNGRARDINWVSPLMVRRGEQAEVLFQSAGELTAYDPETGERRWSYQAKGMSTIPSPVAADDLIFTVGGNGLLALRPGAENRPPALAWQSSKLRASSSSPLAYQGRVYVVKTQGILSCASVGSGKVLWKERLDGAYWASPVAADGKLYVVNEQGTTSVVQAGETPRTLATNALGETILGSPAIAGGAIFLRSDQHLYCIAEKKEK
jgi:outer membrane protein assembly factor BamB